MSGKSVLGFFEPGVIWFVAGNAEFGAEAQEIFGGLGDDSFDREVMEGELRWSTLVFVVKVGGKDGKDVLSFCFVVNNEVVSEDMVRGRIMKTKVN